MKEREVVMDRNRDIKMFEKCLGRGERKERAQTVNSESKTDRGICSESEGKAAQSNSVPWWTNRDTTPRLMDWTPAASSSGAPEQEERRLITFVSHN